MAESGLCVVATRLDSYGLLTPGDCEKIARLFPYNWLARYGGTDDLEFWYTRTPFGSNGMGNGPPDVSSGGLSPSAGDGMGNGPPDDTSGGLSPSAGDGTGWRDSFDNLPPAPAAVVFANPGAAGGGRSIKTMKKKKRKTLKIKKITS